MSGVLPRSTLKNVRRIGRSAFVAEKKCDLSLSTHKSTSFASMTISAKFLRAAPGLKGEQQSGMRS